MPVRPALKSLLALVIGLPVVYVVLAGVANLLGSMGDVAGTKMVACVQALCLALWAVCLVGLVIATAAALLFGRLAGDENGRAGDDRGWGR